MSQNDFVIYPDSFADPSEQATNLSGIIGAGASDAMDNVPQAFNSDDQKLHPDQVAIYEVKITMPLDMGNEWQGAVFQGDLVVDAVQVSNQDPNNVQW